MKKSMIFSILALLPVIVFSQNALTIDAALNNSTSYFSSRITAKTKVVVLNFSSKWPDLSDYIIEELIGYIVNEGKLTVVDRQNLESIRKEMDFQLSGEVSDETAQSIGKKLGAQTIMSGSITAIGNAYRLRIRAISVETAEIIGMQNVDVAQDSRTAALTGTAYTGPAVIATATTPKPTVATSNTSQTATIVSVTTPNMGYIELASAEWKAHGDNVSKFSFNISKEIIESREREVLNLNINIITNGDLPRWAGIYSSNETFMQILKGASGVRLKVLGDGKGWEFSVTTKEKEVDYNYGTTIRTQKDRVAVIDIPYSKLSQDRWARQAPFNKNSIIGLSIDRNKSSLGGAGSSTIKIFDLEIY
jgi:TolB-like protein